MQTHAHESSAVFKLATVVGAVGCCVLQSGGIPTIDEVAVEAIACTISLREDERML